MKNAFDSPYRGRPIESFTFPENGIEGLLTKDSIRFSISVDIELSDFITKRVNFEISGMRKGLETKNGHSKKENFIREKLLRYYLEIEFMPKQGFLRVQNERLCALKNDFTEKKRPAFLDILRYRTGSFNSITAALSSALSASDSSQTRNRKLAIFLF